jgi:dipeptidyl aminopeptidase/acylaminoacyl peptidase
MKKRNITAEDLLKMKFVRSVCIPPDESKIMFTVEVISADKKKYYSHIYMIDADGSNLRQFTFGEVKDSSPVFSPDGKWIVFTSKRGEKKGIYRMPTSGGEAKLLVDKEGSYSDLSISPDSKKILCVFTKDDDVPKDKDGKKELPVYRHITRMFYKLDDSGYNPKDNGHVFVFDIESGEGKQITRGKNGERRPAWFPDSRRIAYIANTKPDPDHYLLYDNIFVASITGGKPRKLNKPDGPVESFAISPNGREIAFIGHDEVGDPWGVARNRLWRLPVSGARAKDLMPKFDMMAEDDTISDTAEGHGSAKPVWSKDSRNIYFIYSEAGSTRLGRISSKGGHFKKVIGGKIHLSAFFMDGSRRSAACIIANHTAPAEVFIWNARSNQRPRQLTKLNDGLLKQINISKPQEVIVAGHDGYPIHGWILKPPDFKASRRYPSIMEIHGGPRVQYGNSFFHEMQYLAAKGYVVYYCNPRGGQGYGRQHAECIVDNWGTLDYDDCISFARHMAGQKYINPRKMGVTGGSYGGYMTNWIIGHTDMFKAAVTQRSVTNFVSMFGSSDIGFTVDREVKGKPWDNLEHWWDRSPIKYVKNIKTPLLIIHSEKDLRCQQEQDEQLFISLKKLRRKAELVLFPDEPHGLSRGGRPDRRIARLEWISKWFDKYLKGKK